MRVMVTFKFPTTTGNEALKAGRIGDVLPKLMEDLKPEAAYFYPTDGMRGGHFIVNVKDGSELLQVGERLWFALGGSVDAIPVMNAEDIQKGLPSVPGIISRFA